MASLLSLHIMLFERLLDSRFISAKGGGNVRELILVDGQEIHAVPVCENPNMT